MNSHTSLHSSHIEEEYKETRVSILQFKYTRKKYG